MAQPTSAQEGAGGSWLLDFNENDINQYRNVPLGSGCGTEGSGVLAGHRLPAARGGTGNEEPIDDMGRVESKWGQPEDAGGYVTFSQTLREASNEPINGGPSLKQLYKDYYITMRWNYASWNWDGSSGGGPEDKAFYSKAPRVMVTNPSTGKSIIAVVLEAGPAPWTGVDFGVNNDPKQGWVNPTVGTPQEYRGRVSGFPPPAITALGATMRMQDGSGHDLVYTWAKDQTALPGPLDENESIAAASEASRCSGSRIEMDDKIYAFPMEPQTKIDYADLPCGVRTGCHHDGTAAFDLLYGAEGSTDNNAVYAITDGRIENISWPYILPDARKAGEAG